MSEWARKADELNRRFMAETKESSRYMSELRSKMKRSPTHQTIYDGQVAMFWISNHLRESTYLGSRDALRKELAEMREHVPTGTRARDPERFAEFYISQIDLLLAEISDGK
jgi:hypothetical protein